MKTSATASFASRMRDSAESPPFHSLTAEEVIQIERNLGRGLTPAEKVNGSLIRRGKVFGRFQPVLATQESDPFEREYLEAKSAARAEDIKRMTPTQRMLAIVEDARAERRAKELAAEAHDRKVTAFRPILESIEQKLLDARFDASVGYEEIQGLWNTRKQILAEGGCPVAAQTMYSACLATETERLRGRRVEVGSKADELRAALARLEAEQAALDVVLDPPKTETESPAMSYKDDPWWKQLDDLHKAGEKASQALNDLVASGAPLGSPERTAAHLALKASNAAVTAHRAARDQQPAAAAAQ